MDNAADIQDSLDQAARLAADYVSGQRSRRVAPAAQATPPIPPSAALPDMPSPAADVIAAIAHGLEPGLVTSTGPRYFGFVVGGVLPVALAAEWLAATWDQNTALHVMSPAFAAVEETAGRWLADILELPRDASFGFVTGATMANWTGLAAARHHVLERVGWDVELRGLRAAPPIRVLVGEERHATIDLALRYLGFGTGTITVLPSDEQGRIRIEPLSAALREGAESPTIVCAQAGNVNSGAFDDIARICDLARGVGAWVHVDAAVGAWLASVPERRHLLRDWGRADSWALDAHKGLNVAYDSGIVFCAHPGAHRAVCAAVAPYLQTVAAGREGSHWVPESSRRARALGIYAVLRQQGRQGVAELTDQLCRLATLFAELLRDVPDARVLNEVVANQVLVRFADSDERTSRVVAAIQEGGVCWVGSTQWRGQLAMRISVSNWSTTGDDVRISVAEIERALAESA